LMAKTCLHSLYAYCKKEPRTIECVIKDQYFTRNYTRAIILKQDETPSVLILNAVLGIVLPSYNTI
jgi:hypothetical protein